MLRLKGRVELDVWDRFSKKIMIDPDITEWIDTRIQSYRYNYVYRKGERGSFYFGYMHNSEKCSRKYNLVVEFNPNKVLMDGYLIEILRMLGDNYTIVSADVAYDFFDLDIRDITYEKGMKRRIMTLSYGGDDLTYYIGVGDGRIKIYNKAKEEGISGIKWTRFEVSWKINISRRAIAFWEVNREGPKIYTYSQRGIIEDKTLRAILYAVENGYPINELTRTYKQKVLDILQSRTEIQIDYDLGKEVLMKTLHQIDNQVQA